MFNAVKNPNCSFNCLKSSKMVSKFSIVEVLLLSLGAFAARGDKGELDSQCLDQCNQAVEAFQHCDFPDARCHEYCWCHKNSDFTTFTQSCLRCAGRKNWKDFGANISYGLYYCMNSYKSKLGITSLETQVESQDVERIEASVPSSEDSLIKRLFWNRCVDCSKNGNKRKTLLEMEMLPN